MELTDILLLIISVLLTILSMISLAIYNSFEKFKVTVEKDLSRIKVVQAEQGQQIKHIERAGVKEWK